MRMKLTPKTTVLQVPARVHLQAMNPLNRSEIARYRSIHAQPVVYKAAARLWASGLDWESAHEIANDAFQTAQVACRQPAG